MVLAIIFFGMAAGATGLALSRYLANLLLQVPARNEDFTLEMTEAPRERRKSPEWLS